MPWRRTVSTGFSQHASDHSSVVRSACRLSGALKHEMYLNAQQADSSLNQMALKTLLSNSHSTARECLGHQPQAMPAQLLLCTAAL